MRETLLTDLLLMLSLLSYTSRTTQPGVGTTHREPSLLTLSIRQENAPSVCPQVNIWGGHFLNGGSLFSNS